MQEWDLLHSCPSLDVLQTASPMKRPGRTSQMSASRKACCRRAAIFWIATARGSGCSCRHDQSIWPADGCYYLKGGLCWYHCPQIDKP